MKTCSFNGLSNFNRRGISQDQVNKKRTLLFFRSQFSASFAFIVSVFYGSNDVLPIARKFK